MVRNISHVVVRNAEAYDANGDKIGVALRIHFEILCSGTANLRGRRAARNSRIGLLMTVAANIMALPFTDIWRSFLPCGISLTWRHAAEPRCTVCICAVRRGDHLRRWTIRANAGWQQWGFARYGRTVVPPLPQPDNDAMRPRS